MRQFIKQNVFVPTILTLTAIMIIYAFQTQSSLQNTSNIYETIVSISLSNLNAGNRHFQVYMLLILMNFSTQFNSEKTLLIFRYRSKSQFFIKYMIKNMYLQILVFVNILVILMYSILLINNSLVLSGDFIIHTIIGELSLVVFYSLFVLSYFTLVNLNLNRHIALILVFLSSMTCSFTSNVFASSLGLLLSNIDVNTDIRFSIIIFFLTFNILLINLNSYLYSRKDVK